MKKKNEGVDLFTNIGFAKKFVWLLTKFTYINRRNFLVNPITICIIEIRERNLKEYTQRVEKFILTFILQKKRKQNSRDKKREL